MSKAMARISRERKQGSFFPRSTSEMKTRPNPVCTARSICVHPGSVRSLRIGKSRCGYCLLSRLSLFCAGLRKCLRLLHAFADRDLFNSSLLVF